MLYSATGEQLTAIANAIRAKTGDSDLLEFPNGFTTEIGTLTDTSDATATASAIFRDDTAYANGTKLTGTLSLQNNLYASSSAETGIKVGKVNQTEFDINASVSVGGGYRLATGVDLISSSTPNQISIPYVNPTTPNRIVMIERSDNSGQSWTAYSSTSSYGNVLIPYAYLDADMKTYTVGVINCGNSVVNFTIPKKAGTTLYRAVIYINKMTYTLSD